MKRKSSKYYSMVYCLLAAAVCLCGCGQGNGAAGSQKGNEIKQEETIYVSQSLSLPEYDSFDGAYSDGRDLYYVAARFDQDLQRYDTAFYTLKQEAAEPEMNFRLGENQRVLSMTMDGAGDIYYIGYEQTSQDSVGGQAVPDCTLYKLDQKGVPLLTLNLTEYTKGQESVMIQDMAVDGANCIVLVTSNQNIFVLDPDGNLLFETKADGMVYDTCSSNGKVFIGYVDGNGMAVKEIDIDGKKLSVKLENNIPGNQFYMAAGWNGDMLIATEESVYQYALEKEEIIKKFDWHTYDFAAISAGILLPFWENGVLAISRNYIVFPMKIEATVFREATEGESVTIGNISSEKTVLTLGSYTSFPAINAEVVAFNKANPDFKIEVRNYEEDYNRLYMEIMAGNGPDLLLLPSHRIGQFAESGVLEDLNPYFAEDETLNRSEFLENILKAFETGVNLYRMPINFNIHTIVGKKSVLGEKSGWNLNELIAFTEGFSRMDIFDNASQSGVLRLLKYAYTDQLVDTDNTSNPLNRELLVKMITFANQYENDDQYTYDENLTGKIMEGRMILLTGLVYEGDDYFGYSSLFGEPVNFIGYPSEGGNGSLINSFSAFAISSSSKYKDIAWKLISTLLSEEAQMRMTQDYGTFSFPIRKDVLEYRLAWIMEHSNNYLIIGNNTVFEYRYPQGYGAVKEEDIRQVRNLIQNVDTVRTVSPDIDQIIEEEASLYFSGIKPVEEVVDVIENRIRTYVNEMK